MPRFSSLDAALGYAEGAAETEGVRWGLGPAGGAAVGLCPWPDPGRLGSLGRGGGAK